MKLNPALNPHALLINHDRKMIYEYLKRAATKWFLHAIVGTMTAFVLLGCSDEYVVPRVDVSAMNPNLTQIDPGIATHLKTGPMIWQTNANGNVCYYLHRKIRGRARVILHLTIDSPDLGVVRRIATPDGKAFPFQRTRFARGTRRAYASKL